MRTNSSQAIDVGGCSRLSPRVVRGVAAAALDPAAVRRHARHTRASEDCDVCAWLDIASGRPLSVAALVAGPEVALSAALDALSELDNKEDQCNA